MQKILLSEFCEVLDLEVLYDKGEEYITLDTPFITRPGIQLTGFYDYFDNDRIQFIGNVEHAYLEHLTNEERFIRLKDLFSQNLPCVVLTRSIDDISSYVRAAKSCEMLLFKSKHNTNKSINTTVTYLEEIFAPKMQTHGVLLDVSGVGVLITGQSGIGKSEIALDLVQKGHRLVADDLVTLTRRRDRVIGSCPKILQYFMEIRGVGIIDIKALFGMGSVRESKTVDLIVEVEKWDDHKHYERLGTEYKTQEFLGMSINKLTVPVVPGRNMSTIIETIARNYRIAGMNYNAGKEFCERVEKYNNDHRIWE